MTGFSDDWLALREPFDKVARSRVLESDLAAWMASRASARPADRASARAAGEAREGGGDALRIVDLGSGTGSNVRHLAPRLPAEQRWTLVEIDRALIESGARRLAGVSVDWRYLQADLESDLPRALAPPVDLVTAAALIDLVSDAWLAQLVQGVRQTRCALLIALTYDGRLDFAPAHADDAWITDLVNHHQRGDKGFGPALGPRAAATLLQLLRDLPGQAVADTSDWRAGPEDQALQRALIEGYAGAAVEIEPASRERVAAWASARNRAIDAARATLTVGHLDILYLPDES